MPGGLAGVSKVRNYKIIIQEHIPIITVISVSPKVSVSTIRGRFIGNKLNDHWFTIERDVVIGFEGSSCIRLVNIGYICRTQRTARSVVVD